MMIKRFLYIIIIFSSFILNQVTIEFDYSGSIETWTVPYDGELTIETYGAQGGSYNSDGGLGAKMVGDFSFTAGEVLQILVGGQGEASESPGDDPNFSGSYSHGGGGGGGTFVVSYNNEPIIIAGGGGGSTASASNDDYIDGQITTSGGCTDISTCNHNNNTINGVSYPNGTNGNGGWYGPSSVTTPSGSGGGGFYNDGFSSDWTNCTDGGQSFLSGGAGGNGGVCSESYPYLGGNGGFGGGGGGDQNKKNGPGGGGGYSGGQGGYNNGGPAFNGGGGGSYNIGTNQDNVAGFNEGNGRVVIIANYYGCLDENADNYNPDASISDGTCEYYVATFGDDTDSNGSSSNPFASIQYAIDQADDNGTIYISGGTYYENVRLFDKTLSIIGQVGQEIIIDAGGNQLPAMKIGSFSGGFYNDGQGSEYVENIYIENLIFENSEAESGLSISSSDAVIENCIARNNNTGRGLYIQSSNNTVVNNSTFIDNSGEVGAGVKFYNSTGSLNNCLVDNNIPTGVLAIGSQLDINNSVIIRNNHQSNTNTGEGGGVGYKFGSNGTIYKTLIASNNSTRGSQVFLESSANVDILKSTIYADENGSGYESNIDVRDNSNLTIENSVYDVFYAYDKIKIVHSTSSLAISYSFIEEGQESILDWNSHLSEGSLIWGQGNIEEYGNDGIGGDGPQFQNPLNDDFRLRYYSPLIDAGDPSSELDEDGTVADMGAYPLNQVPGCIDPTGPNYNENATVPDESCGFNDDNLLHVSSAHPNYYENLALYSPEDDIWYDLEDNIDDGISGNIRIAYDSKENRIFSITGSSSIFNVGVFYPETDTWEQGASLDISYSSSEFDFDVEYDPISNLLVLSDYDASQLEHIYTYNHSTQQWNEITQCGGGIGENNGHWLDYNPYTEKVYLTKRYGQSSNNFYMYEIDVLQSSCELFANNFGAPSSDASTVVFDSKRNRFLFIESDFNNSGDAVENQIGIHEFTDYQMNEIEWMQFNDNEQYCFATHNRMSAVYLPKEDKLLVLMKTGSCNNANAVGRPYIYDFMTDSWTINDSSTSNTSSSGYSDVALINANIGCMDESACNYDATASIDNQNCIMPEGCNDWCDGDLFAPWEIDDCGVCGGLNADIDQCGICFGENASCSGCTDFVAPNYDPDAIVDDGTCEYYTDTTWYVSTDGTDLVNYGSPDYPFGSIQYAVDSVAEGDTIIVKPGTYTQETITMNKAVALISETGRDNTILNSSSTTVIEMLLDPANNAEVYIDGFSFSNAGVSIDKTTGCTDCQHYIKNCSFSYGDYGLRVENINLGNETIHFENNIFRNMEHAVSPFNSRCSFTNNIFYNNTYGVYVGEGPYTNNIIDCVFYNSDIYSNIVQNISYSNLYNSSVNWEGGVFDVIYDDPQFCDPDNLDFSVTIESPLLGASYGGENIADVLIGCTNDYAGPTWYVHPFGSDVLGNGSSEYPFASIQMAINVTPDGDTVSVAAGTYYENINFNGKNISVIGEDRETTIIDGGQNDVVVRIENGETEDALLENFTIKNGGGELFNTNGGREITGGIFISESEPLLNNLIITENNCWQCSALIIQGPINSLSNIPKSIITNIDIINNQCSPQNIDGQYGPCEGALHIYSATPQFENLLIENNENIGNSYESPSGVFADFWGWPTSYSESIKFKNSQIINNHQNSPGEGRGVIYLDDTPIIFENVLISDNSAEKYAGIYINNAAKLEIINTTIVNNISRTNDLGSNFYYNNGDEIQFIGGNCNCTQLSIENSIIWNTNDDNSGLAWHQGGSDMTEEQFLNFVDYSIIQNMTSNSANPQFTDPDNGDYTLQFTSPCIDAGNPNGEYDPDGTIADMGAFYFDQIEFPIIEGCTDPEADNYNSEVNVDNPMMCVYNGPTYYVSPTGNDFFGIGTQLSPFMTIQKGIDVASEGNTVSVAAGTYYENINFNGKNISVIGEDRETTIIDGNATSTVVHFANGESNDALLSGFTIQNGYDCEGGGMECNYGSSPTLTDLIITNNTSTCNGGGIQIEQSSPILSNIIISSNYAPNGGGIFIWKDDSNVILNNVDIVNNNANYGAGIKITTNATVNLSNSTISGNSAQLGGAINSDSNSNEEINFYFENGIISENSATSGGAFYINGNSVFNVENSHISNNTVDSNGGSGAVAWITESSVLNIESSEIYDNYITNLAYGLIKANETVDVTIQNSKIYNNTVRNCALMGRLTISNTEITNNGNGNDSGDVIICPDSFLDMQNVTLANNSSGTKIFGTNNGIIDSWTINNSIIWGNTFEHESISSQNVTVSYSTVQEGINFFGFEDNPLPQWGNGNIEEDPQFIDSDNGDFTLQPSSPCIDSGDPSSDLDSDSTISDMGAYYYDQNDNPIVWGCTNILATNYDADAVNDDGSCQLYSGPTWYVSTAGTNAPGYGSEEYPFSSIQYAIDIAVEGQTILVSQGTYIGQINLNKDNITLASNFLQSQDENDIELTKLVNENTLYDYDRIINCDEGLNNITLIGFTIENGDVVDGVNGGALYLENINNAVINHCIFNNNQASSTNSQSDKGIGGAIYSENSNLNISNSQFLNNRANYGGAIALGPAHSNIINIDNCIFDSNSTEQNSGADIFSHNSSYLNINIESSTVSNSSMPIYLDADYTVTNVSNSLFYNVGEILNARSSSEATFTNCTLYANPNLSTSAGALSNLGDLTVQNCIFYPYDGIGGYHMHDFFLGFNNMEVSYSLTYYSGDYNFDLDPQFTDPENGDLTLQSISPCIDTGNPDFDGDGSDYTIDIDDQDPDGTRMDIGAFYYDQRVYGCLNIDSCNFNNQATDDDGSCISPVNCQICSGETDGSGLLLGIADQDEDNVCDGIDICNGYDDLIDTDGDTVPDGCEINGCDDETACNYDFSATENDGTCNYNTETFYVSLTGDDNNCGSNDLKLRTIQSAVNLAASGDTIYVDSGTYTENVNINNPVKIFGNSNPELTIINANNEGIGFWISGNSTEIKGLKFINGSSANSENPDDYVSGGIYVVGDNNLIENCIFENNTNGIVLSSTNTNINNCIIKNNNTNFNFGNVSAGILLAGGGNNYISNSFIGNNGGLGTGNNLSMGIYSWGDSNPIIDKCTFYNNHIEQDDGSLVISNSIFYGDSYFIQNDVDDDCSITYTRLENDIQFSCTLSNNIFDNPEFVNPSNNDFTLQPSSPCIDAGDPSSEYDPDGTIIDMGAYSFYQIPGCMDITACNYNSLANVNNDSCIYCYNGDCENYSTDYYTCEGICLNNFDSDDYCDEFDDDIDGDQVLNNLDDDIYNSLICSDNDSDGCDDCSMGYYDINNDGEDSDQDGICDSGDMYPYCSSNIVDECNVCDGNNYFNEEGYLPTGSCDCNELLVFNECMVCGGPNDCIPSIVNTTSNWISFYDPVINIEFSMEMNQSSLNNVIVTSQLLDDYNYSITYMNNILTIHLQDVMSLDVINVFLPTNDILSADGISMDLAGAEDINLLYNIHLLADYNNDSTVDITDLNSFISGWSINNTSFELAPFTGIVPNLIPQFDDKFDLQDIVAFIYMWDWSTENNSLLSMHPPNIGYEPEIIIDDNLIKMNLSDISDNIMSIKSQLTISDDAVIHYIDLNNLFDLSLNRENDQIFERDLGRFDISNTLNELSLYSIISEKSQNIDLSYEIYDFNGNMIHSGCKNLEYNPIPESFTLYPNYPNPFNPSTTIKFDIAESSNIKLYIYDIKGRIVEILHDGFIDYGYHEIVWNPKDKAAGIYFVQLISPQKTFTQKITLIK